MEGRRERKEITESGEIIPSAVGLRRSSRFNLIKVLHPEATNQAHLKEMVLKQSKKIYKHIRKALKKKKSCVTIMMKSEMRSFQEVLTHYFHS